MKITILALGSNGDVTPCAALGGALAQRGHQVLLASHADFAPLAQANNLAFTPVAPASHLMVARAGIRLDRMVAQFVEMAGDLARGFSTAALRDVDLILNQLPGGLFGWDLAEKAGIPMAALAQVPIIPTGAFASIGWPSLPWPAYNRLTYRFVENLIWSYFRAPINRWRQHTLDLPPQPRGGYFHMLGTAAVPCLVGLSPVLLPPPPDWSTSVRVTGYWHQLDADWQPPADLLRFLDQGRPPIFIGFGSMTMPDPVRVTRIVLEALRIADLRAVLHTGWAGLAANWEGINLAGNLADPDAPARIYPLHYAPFTWLYQHLAGVVIHGGAGAVHTAARAGVPALVVPFLYDQFRWGKRIHNLGVGPQPLPFKHLTAERLASRLRELVDTPAYAAAAAALGQRVRSENGLDSAVQAIEQMPGPGRK